MERAHPRGMRLRVLDDRPLRADGDYVLYWMVAARRTRWNLALDHALDHARRLRRPLVVLEALRVDYPHASVRFHTWVLQGMEDNAARFDASPVTYLNHVERGPGESRGLVAALAERACLVVTDDTPTFFLPRMLAAVAPRLGARVEAVDGHGLVPLRAAPQAYPAAVHFRRFVQKHAATFLETCPTPDPLDGLDLPRLAPEALKSIRARWPFDRPDPAALPISRQVSAVEARGGENAARERWRAFLETRLAAYPDDRNHPDRDGQSGLSPALHWGHLGAHQMFFELAAQSGWTPARLGEKATGKREGFWNLGAAADAFVDQLVVWRELGANFCVHRPDDAARYEGLPAWAIQTLSRHAGDARAPAYALSTLERAETHDPLWNAAQRQLVSEGIVHNYLRMLWGKKVVEWSATPEDAFRHLVVLNDRWALDGRDPNSYAGIGWVMGRYDHPWPPERPVFGTVRFMSSDSARKKLELDAYLRRHARP